MESSDLRSLPCAAADSTPHIDAANDSSALISGSDSLDLSLSMMPDGEISSLLALSNSLQLEHVVQIIQKHYISTKALRIRCSFLLRTLLCTV